MNSIQVELTFTESVLGTKPIKIKDWKKYLAKDKIDIEPQDEACAAERLEVSSDKDAKGTAFYRTKDGNPMLFDYQLLGFFKDSCRALSRCPGMLSEKLKSSYKSVIDGCVFIQEREIPIEVPPGEEIGMCERPLRIQTNQGERVTMAYSEELPVGSKIKFTILILQPSLYNTVIEWLEYGKLRGIGQWRNASHGRFTYTIVSTTATKSK